MRARAKKQHRERGIEASRQAGRQRYKVIYVAVQIFRVRVRATSMPSPSTSYVSMSSSCFWVGERKDPSNMFIHVVSIQEMKRQPY
jgi:hypothetical protein